MWASRSKLVCVLRAECHNQLCLVKQCAAEIGCERAFSQMTMITEQCVILIFCVKQCTWACKCQLPHRFEHRGGEDPDWLQNIHLHKMNSFIWINIVVKRECHSSEQRPCHRKSVSINDWDCWCSLLWYFNVIMVWLNIQCWKQRSSLVFLRSQQHHTDEVSF